jgi:hypothetical protein
VGIIAGTQTAALGFGGYIDTQYTTAATEEYNGTSWSASPGGGNMNQYSKDTQFAGAGTQTAALGFAGYIWYSFQDQK